MNLAQYPDKTSLYNIQTEEVQVRATSNNVMNNNILSFPNIKQSEWRRKQMYPYNFLVAL